MPFDLNEFWSFVLRMLPAAYAIGAGIILIAWLLNLDIMSPSTKNVIKKIFWALFLLSFFAQISLTVPIILEKYGQDVLGTAMHILVQKIYLVDTVIFFSTGVFSLIFTYGFNKVKGTILFYLIVFPILYTVFLYDYRILTGIALPQ